MFWLWLWRWLWLWLLTDPMTSTPDKQILESHAEEMNEILCEFLEAVLKMPKHSQELPLFLHAIDRCVALTIRMEDEKNKSKEA